MIDSGSMHARALRAEGEVIKIKMDLAHEEALWIEVGFELNEAEMQAKALRAQRDAANNRIKYLENLILSAAKLAGVAA